MKSISLIVLLASLAPLALAEELVKPEQPVEAPAPKDAAPVKEKSAEQKALEKQAADEMKVVRAFGLSFWDRSGNGLRWWRDLGDPKVTTIQPPSSALIGARQEIPLSACPPFAEPGTFPLVSGTLYTQTFFENNTHATNAKAEVEDMRNFTSLGLALHATKNISLITDVILDRNPTLSPPDGRNQFFEDHMLYVNRMYALFHNSNNETPWGNPSQDGDSFQCRGLCEAFVGKFDPNVGLSQYDIPGMYGRDVFSPFALQEKIGAGFAVTGPKNENEGANIRERLEVSTFWNDTTFLSESALKSRGHNDLDDGGAGNTERPNNFAVRMLSGDLDGLGSIGSIGYARQHAGNDGTRNEDRLVLSFDEKTGMQIEDGISLHLIAEQTWLWNEEGIAGNHHSYTTGGLEFCLKYLEGNFRLGGTYTWDAVGTRVADGSGSTTQASIGYIFTTNELKGFSLDFGFKHRDRFANDNLDAIGMMVGYKRSF